MESRVDKATERHQKGYNCAQAVACTYADLVGMDEAAMFKVTEGFGAGMGLPNMKRYTDSMEIDTKIGVGTTVTMRVNLV